MVEEVVVNEGVSMKLKIVVLVVLVLVFVGLVFGFWFFKKSDVKEDYEPFERGLKLMEEDCNVLDGAEKTKCMNDYWTMMAVEKSNMNYCDNIEDAVANQECKDSIDIIERW